MSRLNMTVKLFTGTLNHNQNKTNNKKMSFFYLKIIIFTALKNHSMLHRRVIVM